MSAPCGKPFAPGQWWAFCGQTDMGQTAPVLCERCGGTYKLAEDTPPAAPAAPPTTNPKGD